MKDKIYIVFYFLIEPFLLKNTNINIGEKLFIQNCSICHPGGTNIIIPEKNLKIESLKANGMNSKNALTYQVINGKNGMPAFGDRLKEFEIDQISDYILLEGIKNFEKK
jgi:cytochrome c6